MIDCEAVICDEQGKSDFDRFHSRCFDAEATAYAFDLIELGGSTQQFRLEERKQWDHSIREVEQTRYSVMFRTLRQGA